MAKTVRLDKYLWAIRAFKTRGDATKACKGNKVKVNEVASKPAKLVEVGDIIQVRKGAVFYRYKVLKLAQNRVGAKLVPDLAKNITPKEELDKLNVPHETVFLQRDRGMGRPTKKDRRVLEDVMGNLEYSAPNLDEVIEDEVEDFDEEFEYGSYEEYLEDIAEQNDFDTFDDFI